MQHGSRSVAADTTRKWWEAAQWTGNCLESDFIEMQTETKGADKYLFIAERATGGVKVRCISSGDDIYDMLEIHTM